MTDVLPAGTEAGADKSDDYDPDEGKDESLIGVIIRKKFELHGTFTGKVIRYDNPYYKIYYPYDAAHPDHESDYEDFDPEEVEQYRVDEQVEAQFTQAEAVAEATGDVEVDAASADGEIGEDEEWVHVEEEAEVLTQEQVVESQGGDDSESDIQDDVKPAAASTRSSRGKPFSVKGQGRGTRGDRASTENGRRSSARSARRSSILDDSEDSDKEDEGEGKDNGKRSTSKGGKRPSKRSSSGSSSSDGDDSPELEITLKDRREALTRRSAAELQTLKAHAQGIVERHHANTSTLSPVRSTSKATVKSLEKRSKRGKIGMELGEKANYDRGEALDRRVREHLDSLENGEAPKPEIYRFMTVQEKEQVKLKRMAPLIKQWEENARRSQERAAQQSPEHTFEAIRLILLHEMADEVNQDVERLMSIGESRHTAYQRVAASVADEAALLVDEGYMAVDGGIYYPDTATGSASSSAPAPASAPREAQAVSAAKRSGGKPSRSMSASASRVRGTRVPSSSSSPPASDPEASVHTQAGADYDSAFDPTATAPQPESESFGGDDGDDENFDLQTSLSSQSTTASGRRRQGLSSGKKKRRLSAQLEQRQALEKQSRPKSMPAPTSTLSPSLLPRPTPAPAASAAASAGSATASDGADDRARARKRQAVEAARRNMAKKAARIVL